MKKESNYKKALIRDLTNQKKEKCFQNIVSLVNQADLENAFKKLIQNLSKTEDLKELHDSIVVNSAYYKRTKKYFFLGNISWQALNLSQNEITQSLLMIAREFCNYSALKEYHIGQEPETHFLLSKESLEEEYDDLPGFGSSTIKEPDSEYNIYTVDIEESYKILRLLITKLVRNL